MEKPLLLFKYGGNAMTDQDLKKKVLKNICMLNENYNIVIVHGGGPFIKDALEKANINSVFINGQRQTSVEALEQIEMVLKGKVNGNLVSIINAMGYKAVGLSGKDGKTVTGKKRTGLKSHGLGEEIDLGRVADVYSVDTTLIKLLVKYNFIPVLTCIASDQEGVDYNINADMFAGHVAGTLKVHHYIILTDVNGLFLDKENPETLIRKLNLSRVKTLKNEKVISGGMIPKIESCEIAIRKGAKNADIINGTEPGQILDLLNNKEVGTMITEN